VSWPEIALFGPGGGGAATPGGADTQVQFNNGGSFAGSALLTFNKATGALSTTRVLVGDGTAAAPSMAFASSVNTGLFYDLAGGNGMMAVSSGTPTFRIGTGFVVMPSTATLSWASGVLLSTTGDTHLTRPAAATIQMGQVNSATGAAVAQTLQTQSNITQTDVNAPASFTVIGPRGTGTGTTGTIIFQNGVPQTTGNTAHVPVTTLTLTNTGTGGTSAPLALLGGTLSTASNQGAFSGNNLWLNSTGQIAFTSGGAYTNTKDTILERGGAAATFQFGGANAASPVNQRLQSQGSRGGQDTDVPGSNLTVASGAGTGAAGASLLIFSTPATTTTGTTQQTVTQRMSVAAGGITFNVAPIPASTDSTVNGAAALQWSGVYVSRGVFGSKTKTFTNNTKTGFVTIAVPSSTVATGTIIYEIFVADATNTQAISGELKFSAAANSSGTVTAATTVDAFTPLNPCTSGTLTNAITQTTGTNTLTIEFQPNTSLTSTTREIHYRINSPGTMTITPL